MPRGPVSASARGDAESLCVSVQSLLIKLPFLCFCCSKDLLVLIISFIFSNYFILVRDRYTHLWATRPYWHNVHTHIQLHLGAIQSHQSSDWDVLCGNWRKPMDTWQDHVKLHANSKQNPGWNQGPWDCEAAPLLILIMVCMCCRQRSNGSSW